MNIYRKLKHYISLEEHGRRVIFGDLTSPDCEFSYIDNETCEWKTFNGGIVIHGTYDFLYEYYVVGMFPRYKIVNDKIVPYLEIILQEDYKK